MNLWYAECSQVGYLKTRYYNAHVVEADFHTSQGTHHHIISFSSFQMSTLFHMTPNQIIIYI